MPDKPSSNEEEYFLKLEQERMARRREEASKQAEVRARDERRALHHMKCPKCGGDLKEEHFKGISIDRCTECTGVWFDAGELEALTGGSGGAVQGFFGDLFKGFGGGRKSS